MSKNLFLAFLILMLISIASFFSCNSESNNGYDSRIRNIINFLKTEQSVNIDSCNFVYLIQSSKCSSCTKENLEIILKDVNDQRKGNVIFVMNAFNEVIFDFLLLKSEELNFKLIVDQEDRLNKYGLSFMKNLQIVTCNMKVESWKFYD